MYRHEPTQIWLVLPKYLFEKAACRDNKKKNATRKLNQ
jgi:hypothetical protein